jgi:hypothetical protein
VLIVDKSADSEKPSAVGGLETGGGGGEGEGGSGGVERTTLGNGCTTSARARTGRAGGRAGVACGAACGAAARLAGARAPLVAGASTTAGSTIGIGSASVPP